MLNQAGARKSMTSPTTPQERLDRPYDLDAQAPALRQAVQDSNRAAYRDAILDAAASVFLHNGLHGARVADIARGAGVSVGTVYNHFPSKEELFRALFARDTERFLQVATAQRDHDSHLDNLRETLLRILSFIQQRGPAFIRYTHRAMLTDAESALVGNNPLQSKLAHHLEGVIRAAVDAGELRADVLPAVLTTGYLSMVAGIVNSWLHDDGVDMQATATQMLHLFLEGAGPR
jgi:AcrR family transcriptional regulator